MISHPVLLTDRSKKIFYRFSIGLLLLILSPSLTPSLFAQTSDCVIDANFSIGTEGFIYSDSQNNSQYADGEQSNSGNPGGALALYLGGFDNNSYSNGVENGWESTITGGGALTISGDFSLFMARYYEGDEYGDVLLRVNGTAYGLNGNDYLFRLYGSDTDQSSDYESGWTSFSVTIPGVASGDHVLKLAAFNNKKTRQNETVEVRFDNIEVCFTPEAPDITPPTIEITQPTNQTSYVASSNSIALGGTAIDDRGVSSVSWQNQTTSQTGAANGTDNWTTATIALNNGNNVIVVTAADAAGNLSSDTLTVSYTPDLTAPVISNVQVSNITHNSATITWATDETANSQVEYGQDTSYGSTSNVNNNLTQLHSVTLSGLSAEMTYHFRALSADDNNNQATGTDSSFTTEALPPDTEPPTVSLTAPACNATIAGNVTISAAAGDNETLVSVEFFVDGNSLGLVSSPPYNVSWNTTTFSEGVHAILLRATDAAGNIAEAGCSVMVGNLTPVCVIDANFSGGTEGFSYIDSNNHPQYADGSLRSSGNPGNALALFLAGVDDNSYYDGNENSWQMTIDGGGDVTISGDFNLLLTRNFEGEEYGEIRIRLNNTLYGVNGVNYVARLYGSDTDQSSDYTTGWTAFSVTIPNVANGNHALKLAAFNNQKTRANEKVTAYFDNIEVCFTPSVPQAPDTTPPVVTITSPTSQNTITVGNNSITLGGSASDDRGVTSVSWENQTTGQTGAANGAGNWTTPAILLDSGNNTIIVFAVDAANNFGSDTLTVNYDSSTDNNPPVISNVQANPLTPTSVTISWQTDEPATSQVQYALNIAINGTIKIMPLGDSITSGFNSYRTSLYNQLDNAGYDIDFVGSRSDGNNPDPDHEGHGGWLAEAIDANINNWLSLSNPDVVLYHIGTNDVTSIFDYDRTIGDISATLDKIWAYNANTWVLLSQIVPRSDNSFFDDRTETLNGFIAQLVQSEQSAGKPISTVDHYSAFKAVSNWETGLLSDGKHPNSNGYTLMADIYYAGLVQVLGDGSSEPVQTPVDNNLVTQHQVTLTGLSENQVYTFSVTSADASNNSTTSSEATFQTPSSGNILADFSGGNDGFSFVDSNNHPQYADGSHTNNGHPGGSLRIDLAGVDNNSYYDGNSAGWELTFTAGGDITISGEYNMLVARNFESSEYGQVGLIFDGAKYGSGGNDYFERLYGDAVQTQDHVSGWTSFSVTIPGQNFQTHTLQLAGFNNRKTRANEYIEIDFDNIQITTSGQTLALLNAIKETARDLAVLPENQLMGNYPNPFNPTTKIMYNLKEATQVQVKIFNILGQEVTTLFDNWQTRGISTLEWNGQNSAGIQVATGVYIVRIKTDKWLASHKLNLVK